MIPQPPEGRAPDGEYLAPVWLALLLWVVPLKLLLRVARHMPYAIQEPLLRHLLAWVGQLQPAVLLAVPKDPLVAYDGPIELGVLPDASLVVVQPGQTPRRYANLGEVEWPTRREPLPVRAAVPSRERVHARARETRPRARRTRAGASRDGPSRSDDDPHDADPVGRSRGRLGVVPRRARR